MANLMQEKTNDTYQSMWPRMHFLREAIKHPNDIDAKLSQYNDFQHGGSKAIELREFSDWKESRAKDPNLFLQMRDKIDEKVGVGMGKNCQQEDFKEFMYHLIRYYVDPKTNKLFDHDLDRRFYSLTAEPKASFTYGNKEDLLYGLSKGLF